MCSSSLRMQAATWLTIPRLPRRLALVDVLRAISIEASVNRNRSRAVDEEVRRADHQPDSHVHRCRTSELGAQSAEHEAIKTMLHAETAAFYARDADAWQAQWLHDANATGALVGNNRYTYMKGWEAIAQRVARSIQANPKPMLVEIANTNFIIRQEGDLAWVDTIRQCGELGNN